MKLQLVDGHIERPIKLLEGVIITSCGVEYEHTFAIVDFGKSPYYEITFGRKFMRQLKMIKSGALTTSTYGNKRQLLALIC